VVEYEGIETRDLIEKNVQGGSIHRKTTPKSSDGIAEEIVGHVSNVNYKE